MLTVYTVLKSGGIYSPRHVSTLREQVQQHLPGARFVALTDQYVPGTETARLKLPYMGWWAKMELFRPDILGDILYFDLDTVIRGSLEAIAAVNRLTVLANFYAKEPVIGSGVMYIPQADRAEIWEAWTKNPRATIHTLGVKGLGDQEFLRPFWYDRAARFQDLVPGQIVSYKAHCNPQWRAGAVGTVPEGARVICAHGRPKPWSSEWRLAA